MQMIRLIIYIRKLSTLEGWSIVDHTDGQIDYPNIEIDN